MCTALLWSRICETVYLVSKGNNKELAMFLLVLFAMMLIAGPAANQWSFKGYGALMKESGRAGSDFIKKYGRGVVYINMALLGIVFTAYILIVGGKLNGPTIGGIFTVVGFGAIGKHLKMSCQFAGVFWLVILVCMMLTLPQPFLQPYLVQLLHL